MTHDPNLPPRQREPEHEVFDLTAILADERAVEMLRAHAGDPEDLDDRMLMLLAALARDARGTSTSSAEPVTPRRKTQRRRLSQRARGTVSGAVRCVSPAASPSPRLRGCHVPVPSPCLLILASTHFNSTLRIATQFHSRYRRGGSDCG